MGDIRREDRRETQGAGTRLGRAGTEAGTTEGEGGPHPGRVRPASSWLPELLGPGKEGTRAQFFVPHFCGTPEGWNRAQHKARSI